MAIENRVKFNNFGCRLSDFARATYFRHFDSLLSNLSPNLSYHTFRHPTTDEVVVFKKHPVSGEWMLVLGGILYTRRRVSSAPWFHDVLNSLKFERAGIAAIVGGHKYYFRKDTIGCVNVEFLNLHMQFLFNEDDDEYCLINTVELQLKTVSQNTPVDINTGEMFVIIDDAFYWKGRLVNELEEDLNIDMGKYRARTSDKLLINVLDSGNSNVALLLGKPGTGKTFFTNCYAQRIGAEYIYTLCHDGTNAEDLFYQVNVGKAVLREAEKSSDVYQEGVLLKAARLSHTTKVVICIDEIDKASKRTENLFLDFAENYRVPFLGEQEQANPENIVLFFTSNGYRPHSEAFLRRCYRHHFDFLPRSTEIELIGGSFAPLIVDALTAIRNEGASSPSVKEGILFAKNLQFAKTVADVECLMYAHLVKEEEDMAVLQKGNYANRFITKVF